MNAPTSWDLELPRTAAALDAFDEATKHAFDCAINDTAKLQDALDAEDEAGRQVVIAFVAETATRNSESDVRRYMRWDDHADRQFIRRMVRQWRSRA